MDDEVSGLFWMCAIGLDGPFAALEWYILTLIFVAQWLSGCCDVYAKLCPLLEGNGLAAALRATEGASDFKDMCGGSDVPPATLGVNRDAVPVSRSTAASPTGGTRVTRTGRQSGVEFELS